MNSSALPHHATTATQMNSTWVWRVCGACVCVCVCVCCVCLLCVVCVCVCCVCVCVVCVRVTEREGWRSTTRRVGTKQQQRQRGARQRAGACCAWQLRVAPVGAPSPPRNHTATQRRARMRAHLDECDGRVHPVLQRHLLDFLQQRELLLLGVCQALELGRLDVRAGDVEALRLLRAGTVCGAVVGAGGVTTAAGGRGCRQVCACVRACVFATAHQRPRQLHNTQPRGTALVGQARGARAGAAPPPPPPPPPTSACRRSAAISRLSRARCWCTNPDRERCRTQRSTLSAVRIASKSRESIAGGLQAVVHRRAWPWVCTQRQRRVYGVGRYVRVRESPPRSTTPGSARHKGAPWPCTGCHHAPPRMPETPGPQHWRCTPRTASQTQGRRCVRAHAHLCPLRSPG
jgi:hypothetical protein